MKKSKILVPAVALLALGIAGATTGTVAWFSMNTQVQADGMTIKSTTSKSLMISLVKESGYGTAVTMAATKESVLPASPVDATALTSINQSESGVELAAQPSFVRVNVDANAVKNPAASAATYTIEQAKAANKIGTSAGAEGDYYLIDNGDNYAHDDVWLLYTEEENSTSDVNLTLNFDRGSAMALDPAYRFAIWDGAKFYTWAPFATGEATDVSKTANAFVTLTHGVKKNLFLYAWFEGTDSACTTMNAINVQNINVVAHWSLATSK